MLEDAVRFTFNVDGDDFSSAGAASVQVKKHLRQMGFSPEIIRRVAIAMYEGEINMVIHADGGVATVEVTDDSIVMILEDKGPGKYPLSRLRSRNGLAQYEKIFRFPEN